jgi:hypothetical protein
MKNCDGFPVIANGIPVIDSKLNNIEQSLEKSRVIAARKREKIKNEYDKLREAEFNDLYSKILSKLKNNQINECKVTIQWRSLYHETTSSKNIQEKLNIIFNHDHNVNIKNLNIFKRDYDDDVMCCLTTSVCCCIPLVYWIPKWIIDEKKGYIYNVIAEFS